MSEQARRLWLVRHAQPLIDKGICYGHLDVPADHEATQQAAQSFANTLKIARSNNATSLNTQPILIYVSGLLRAQQLADEMLFAFRATDIVSEVRLQTDCRLNEMNFGSWEGKPWSAIPKEALDQWSSDFSQHKFGGEESSQDVINRVQAAYQTSLELAQASNSSDVIWITHAGVIRALNYVKKYATCVIERAEQWPQDAPGFGQWLCMDLTAITTK